MSNPTVEAVRAQFPPFEKFPSVPRLFREIIVTEKIDGTNASIQVNEDGTVWAGSRNRWITPESDNFGFAAWVKAHEEELRKGLGAGRHFGEWYGAGIQRGYGLTEKRFALFNVSRFWSNFNQLYFRDTPQQVPPDCCEVVPIVSVGVFDTGWINRTAADLETHGSLAVPGFMQPEGVVVFHAKSGHLYKYTFGSDGHKTQ